MKQILFVVQSSYKSLCLCYKKQRGAGRSVSVLSVFYPYVKTSRATGLLASAELLGSCLLVQKSRVMMISRESNPPRIFPKVPFQLKLLPNLSISSHRIIPSRNTPNTKNYPELSSSAAHHRSAASLHTIAATATKPRLTVQNVEYVKATQPTFNNYRLQRAPGVKKRQLGVQAKSLGLVCALTRISSKSSCMTISYFLVSNSTEFRVSCS